MALELRLWFNEDDENDFEILSEIGAKVAREYKYVNYSVEEVEL